MPFVSLLGFSGKFPFRVKVLFFPLPPKLGGVLQAENNL